MTVIAPSDRSISHSSSSRPMPGGAVYIRLGSAIDHLWRGPVKIGKAVVDEAPT
jgi:hypothetical protein